MSRSRLGPHLEYPLSRHRTAPHPSWICSPWCYRDGGDCGGIFRVLREGHARPDRPAPAPSGKTVIRTESLPELVRMAEVLGSPPQRRGPPIPTYNRQPYADSANVCASQGLRSFRTALRMPYATQNGEFRQLGPDTFGRAADKQNPNKNQSTPRVRAMIALTAAPGTATRRTAYIVQSVHVGLPCSLMRTSSPEPLCP